MNDDQKTDERLGYREISDELARMTGYTCGHTTVRNMLMNVLERFAAALMVQYGVMGDPAIVARMKSFQTLLESLLYEAYMNGV